MTFTEPRTVLFAVGDKDSVETKLSWRWCRDNMLLPSDNLWLVHARRKDSGWVPLDSVKTLSDVSLAKDWLPSEIAHSIHGMQHKLIVIDTAHDSAASLRMSCSTPRYRCWSCARGSTETSPTSSPTPSAPRTSA
jgi:hypothetical protein